MTGPADLFRKAKALLSREPQAGPPRPPKPPKSQWLAYFGDLAEQAGVKKRGKVEWAVGVKQRKALMDKAASHAMLETMGFLMCGMYYITNPKDARLARGIKTVFLTSAGGNPFGAGGYALNLNQGGYKEIDLLAQWGGFNDISAMLDAAADSLMNGGDSALPDFFGSLKKTASGDGLKNAKRYTDGLRKELADAGWKAGELQAIGL